jgi:hypothetical protein
VAVSTENGSAADVSVTLTAQPSSQKPTFTSGCTTGDKTATCTVSSVSDDKAVDLDAQIPVASSVSSVKLTATASIVTTAKWTPPEADATVTVTSPSAKSPAKASSAKALPESIIPLGPLPELNGVSSSLIGAGNAAGLFPAISPAPAASAAPSPSAMPARSTRRNAATAADSSALAPVLTAQIAGLVALAAAIALTMTRKRFRSRR